MYPDPESDSVRKNIRHNRFPLLKYQHPAFEMERRLREDDLKVLLCLKAKLEEVRA